MPPGLPVVGAAPFRPKPFNPAIKDALLHAFEDVAADEIPSFFQQERPHPAGGPQASLPALDCRDSSPLSNSPPIAQFIQTRDQPPLSKAPPDQPNLPPPS